MPALPNTRQEAFAQNLAKGMTQQEAYREAGYSDSAANASVQARKPAIRARVLEISQEEELKGRSSPMPPLQTDFRTGMLTPESVGLTEEWLVQQLRTNIQQAQIAGKFREANTAIEMLGNYFGGLFDKKNPVDQTKKNKDGKESIPNGPDGEKPRSLLDMVGDMSAALQAPDKDDDDKEDE